MKIKKEIKEKIDNSNNILVVISRPIDYDGLASGIVLKRFLEKAGKTIKLIAPIKIPIKYQTLPFIRNVLVKNPKKIDLVDYDLIIALDGGNKKQFARVDVNSDFDFGGNLNILNIDHHLTNAHFAKYEIWDKNASSTVELLMCTLIDVTKLEKNEATLLYFGLVGDTGNFKYSLTKDTLRLASLLFEKGADYKIVVKHYFNQRTKLDFEIFTYLIEETIYERKLGYTYVVVNYDEIVDKFECKPGLIKRGIKLYQDYFSCSIRGIHISVVFRVIGSNVIASVKGDSLSNRIPLSEISDYLKVDGGGHFHSAGFALKGDIDNVLGDFKNIIIKLRKKYNQR